MKMRKIAVILLALALVLSLGITVSAEHNHDYTADYEHVAGTQTHYGICSCGEKSPEPLSCAYPDEVPSWYQSPYYDREGLRDWECTLCNGKWRETVPAHRCEDYFDVDNWTMYDTSYHYTTCTFPGCGGRGFRDHYDYMGEAYHTGATSVRQECTECEFYREWNTDATQTHVDGKPVSCAAPGNLEHWLCDHCGKYFADENCLTELKPADVFLTPPAHTYADGICTVCGTQVQRGTFAKREDVGFGWDDEDYFFVIVARTEDGTFYAMGEDLGDGRRAAVEIPNAQVDENGMLHLTSDMAEFMTYTYDGYNCFVVDGGYLAMLGGEIYVYDPAFRNDPNNASPACFGLNYYDNEDCMGYLYSYPGDHYGQREYMVFNAETLCFEVSATEVNTLYLYKQVCEHEKADVVHYHAEPTCTQQGIREYWECSKCYEVFSNADCTEPLEIPENVYDIREYMMLPALGHSYNSEGVCVHCSMKRPVYSQVSTLAQFDALGGEAYYIFVVKDGDKTYAATLPPQNPYAWTDRNYNDIPDALEVDENGNGIPDIVEGTDVNENGIPDTEEEWILDDEVNMDDWIQLFFELQWNFDEQQFPNFVEVTMAPDGTITLTEEGAMELQMMHAGISGGAPYDQEMEDYLYQECGITDQERIRAAWIPNYWIACSGNMGYYAEGHFLIQNRIYGDDDYAGVLDNRNWKISFREDGTACLVSTWSEYDDTCALQLVKYIDEEGNPAMTIVSVYEWLWADSYIMQNATETLPVYLFASEPEFLAPEYTSGDANGDEDINGKDLILLRQSLAGWDVEMDEAAADCNSDGQVNGKDLILLRQYLAGWDVVLGPEPEPEPEPILVSSITLSADTQTLSVGDILPLTATILPADATVQTLSWSVTSGSACVSVSSDGVVTAEAVGTATIKAAATDGSGQYATITITVTTDAERPLWEGSGTREDPYLIRNITDLMNIRKVLSESGYYFLQTADIDTSRIGAWIVLGTESSPFRHHYDGGNYRISNLHLDNNYPEDYGDAAGGLFTYAENATFRNMNIVNATTDENHTTYPNNTAIYAGNGPATGAIVGQGLNCAFYNCTVSVDFRSSNQWTGGIIGCVILTKEQTVLMENCHASGYISGSNGTGGLIGVISKSLHNEDWSHYGDPTAVVRNCTSSAEIYVITGAKFDCGIGGLIGSANHVIVEHCHATGKVTAASGYIGGLIGNAEYDCLIACCSAKGDVICTSDDAYGGSFVGGLLGYMLTYTTVHDCYATGDVYAETLGWSDCQDKGSYNGGPWLNYRNPCGALIGCVKVFDDIMVYNNYALGDVYAPDICEDRVYCHGALVGCVYDDYTRRNITDKSKKDQTDWAGFSEVYTEYFCDNFNLEDLRTYYTPQNYYENYYGLPEKYIMPQHTYVQILTGELLLNQSTFQGWDFENIWIMTEDGPQLRSESNL